MKDSLFIEAAPSWGTPGGTSEGVADDCGATTGGALVPTVDSGETAETAVGASVISVTVEVSVVSTSMEEETGASVTSAEEEGNGQ